MLQRNPFKIPPAGRHMRIGLFGGSFNPPHLGHVHVSNIALRRLDLDQIWWLVSPGNPLKDHNILEPLTNRISKCQQITHHPDIRICAFEKHFNTRFTADTLEILKSRRPTAKFVWVMGADNFATFHKWDRWQKISRMVPLAIIDRPGSTISPNSTPATKSLSKYRIDEGDSTLLAHTKTPAWTFIHAPRSFLSSTKIRESNR